jgi:signal transduction histidine kinase
MRPLDRLPSLKLKLGVVIVAAVVVTLIVNEIGLRLELGALERGAVAALIALGMVQLLAHGMTLPLRQMATAAKAMAHGDTTVRVHTSSRDEVGELAMAFNAMAAELAEVDRMRRDLVANVSHELRTPISALQAVLENIVDGVELADPDVLRTMSKQVERLGRLVTQLLDLSRLESGAIPLEWASFDVHALLDDVAGEARLTAGSVDIVVDVDAGLLAAGDTERIHQVLANLVENAVRYSPEGAPVVLSASRHGDGGVTFAVADDGPGIADDDVGRVFERFYRSDPARAIESGGAGLGLAIARWIVDLHGGTIHYERRHPAGCRMVVTLPPRSRCSGVPVRDATAAGSGLGATSRRARGRARPDVRPPRTT